MAPGFQAASRTDEDLLVSLMRDFYVSEHLLFEEPVIRGVLRELLGQASLGTVHLIRVDGGVAGYATATNGFSMEFGGRFVLLDELFVCEAFRGRGLAKAALFFLEERCRQEGAKALILEVNRENLLAREIYLKAGFTDHGRFLMTRRITS